MFTGIIEYLGTVKNILKKGRVVEIGIECKRIAKEIKIGESVSVNGVCLTVVRKKAGVVVFEVQGETLRCTGLGNLKKGSKVNLERALAFSGRMNGHFVQGHVDAVGKLRKLKHKGEDVILDVSAPKKLMPYIVPKGSISVEGVSLTVVDVRKKSFTVHLIPHTLKETTFDRLKVGQKLNLEADILAKYMQRLLSSQKGNGKKRR